MKSKIKKLVTIALATTMLLGATLTVNAAEHYMVQVTYIGTCNSSGCGSPAYFYRCAVSGCTFHNPHAECTKGHWQ